MGTQQEGTGEARRHLAFGLLVLGVLVALYWRSFREMITVWLLVDSYYTHGFLVPLVSLFFVWHLRGRLAALPVQSDSTGFFWVWGSALLLLAGDFLGFRVFSQISLVPMIVGILLLLYGGAITRALWFPIVYLFFMIPIPPSLTQSIALRLKLFATECAVMIAGWCTIPLVRDGSMVYWTTSEGTDHLLIGDVCGGLRSLIALLAFGAIMAYISKTRAAGRWAILLLSPVIAIVSNISRVFLLCVVGYFYGSKTAAGRFHDISGYLIFVVAFILFFALEKQLRRWLPLVTAEPDAPRTGARGVWVFPSASFKVYLGVVSSLVIVAAVHVVILTTQFRAGQSAPAETIGAIPSRIADYVQVGSDETIDPRTAAILETSTVLIRNYNSGSGWPVQLVIVYAGATRRSLHFPEVCLMGSGWELKEQTTTQIGILFSAKRLVLVNGRNRQAVLYWFKTGDYLTGNYFVNALHWTANQMMFASPTSAMIQVATPIGTDGEDAAFAILEDFAVKLYPEIMRHVP